MISWDLAVKNFIEVFVFMNVALFFEGMIFMSLIVNWQSRNKAFVVSWIITLVLMTLFYLIYALLRVYIL